MEFSMLYNSSRLLCAVACSLLLCSACGSGPLSDGTASLGEVVSGQDAAGEWCQALAVFRTSCQQCHGQEPAFGAPMSLVSHGDTQGEDGRAELSMVERIAERVHSADAPMPPVSQEPLTDAQLAAIDDWVAAGAPSADDPSCGGEPDAERAPQVAEFEWPQDCEEFHRFTAGGADGQHVVPADSETHPQFKFDIPWGGEGPVQALAMRPIIDNERVVHHWILEEGLNFLTGWAPGGQGQLLPEGVGMIMPLTGQLNLDMHYFNVGNDADEPDDSGVEICITRHPRAQTAATYPFAAPATVPAGQRVTNENTCIVQTDEPAFVIGSSPHMHQLGVYAKLEILRKDGSVETLHDGSFAFEDQLATQFEPVELQDGDKVRTTCIFQNDTERDVRFGDGSYDEMCFNFATYYPACAMRCVGGDLVSFGLTLAQGGGCPSGT